MARKSILKRERRELRAWYLRQQPRPSHRECIVWFEEKFQQKLSQATISKSLSHRYSYLDDSTVNSILETGCRSRSSKWPILEQTLFEWQQSMEAQQTDSGATAGIPGDILIAKAMEIWPKIPQYRGLPQPHFSSGWLTNYKARHHLKIQQLHHQRQSKQQSQQQQQQQQLLPQPPISQEDTNLLSASTVNTNHIISSHMNPLSDDDSLEDMSVGMQQTPNIRRMPEVRIPTPHEALKGLQTYLMFKAYQDDAKPTELRSLILQEQQMQLIIENTCKQSTLDNWLNN